MSGAPGLKVLSLVGPTGVGKTGVALALAQAVNGAVVNADSRQVYRGIPVTTAQPSAEETARCPHVLYGFLDLSRKISAGAWAEMAASAVTDLAARGYTPILVGGTGLYLRALLTGLAPMPDVPEALRREVARQWDIQGAQAMHERLAAVDPEYAARIHPNDRQRVTRALEIHQVSGVPFSTWHAETAPALEASVLPLGLTMERQALHRRLAERIEAMCAQGALEEIRRALAACPDPHAPGLTGIGCAELAAYLRGRLDWNAAREKWLVNTKAYAKRQMTWFGKERDILWFEPDRIERIVGAAVEWLSRGR